MDTLAATQILDPLTVPLQGINLIEASAGTGKTYTIATLFIRLLLENHLAIDKILVVTFTEAATEELRDRIRQRLVDTLTAFQQGHSEDNTLAQLLQQVEDHQEATFRLTQGLRDFDEAAIFTIHGFCLKMLQDNAFESGILFDNELIRDQSHFLKEIVADFWRQHIYPASALFIDHALKSGYHHPDQLLTLLGQGRYVGQPFLKITPLQAAISTTGLEAAFQHSLATARQTWLTQQADIKTLLLENDALNGQKYHKTRIPQWIQALDAFFSRDLPTIDLPDMLIKWTRSALQAGTKKGKTPPQHLFFEQCETLINCQQDLVTAFEQQLHRLKVKLLTTAAPALAQKKYQHHVQSFDDLLLNLYNALTSTQGAALAQRIHKQYWVALIDEFQDTDPVQYQIFRRIYGQQQHPTLFLIGDPKQAIYSFRGADIFTYRMACQEATNRYTLPTNWRSEARLIQAVNQLFTQDRQPLPFIFNYIPFYPVQAPEATTKATLYLENQCLPPLQLWFVSREQAQCAPDKLITKTWAKQHLPHAVAHEIARLLTTARIDEHAMVPSDIAVLVRTHVQAHLIQQALTHLQIPSVLYSQDSLFHAYEALETERILLAVATPNDAPLLKAALATDMLGYSGEQIDALTRDENAWQACLRRFQRYHFLWRQTGFMPMYRILLAEEGVQTRLLRYPEGERRLTNVLHLAELLQQTSLQQNFTLKSLCQWLSQQLRQPRLEDEAQQLRLESDEKRIKIITIHKSKGLEYNVVFCPFVWDGYLYTAQDNIITFHDDQGDPWLDVSAQPQHRQRAQQEELAENLRLFYVAVTRAKYRCYLIWGAFKAADCSALAHLLHPGTELAKMTDAALWTALQTIARASHNTLQVAHLPTAPVTYQRPAECVNPLVPRPFLGHVAKDWQITSFTALTALATVDQPDHDEAIARVRTLHFTASHNPIFNFPSGTKAGMFMHSLFENLDFTQIDVACIENQLNLYGYEVVQWQTVIQTLVTHVVNTPLHPQQPTFTLSQISRDKRLNELEFYYPFTSPTTLADLKILLEAVDQNLSVDHLTQATIQGFMKGFIDMVFEYQGRFYLVDYKSNWLGNQMQHYHHTLLHTVMKQEHYDLQYYLYTVALHRYLSLRLPHYRYEDHFGGIYYLFVRGMHPHWGAHFGIYYRCPDAHHIQMLSNYFSEGKTALEPRRMPTYNN